MTPYVGLVASKCYMCHAPSGVGRSQNSLSPHYARTDISWLKIAVPNWYVKNSSPFNEIVAGGDSTITASVEYPQGVFTRILWGGNVTGTLVDGTTTLSDQTTVAIPNGALFWIRMYIVGSTNVFSRIFAFNPNHIPASQQWMGAEAFTADKTMGGTITKTNATFCPIAIIGPTDKPSIALLGDSIGIGELDGRGDLSGDYGLARAFGDRYAYLNFALSGDRAAGFLADGARRADVLKYASHLLCAYGNNDIYTLGNSAAITFGRLQNIWQLMKAHGQDKKTFQTTISVRATSTDGWTTLANQTTLSGNAARVSLNALIRAGDPDLDGYIDFADVLESSRESGKWKPGPTANYLTSDGTHPVTQGYFFIKESGAFYIPDSTVGGGAAMTVQSGQDDREKNQGGTGILTKSAGPSI